MFKPGTPKPPSSGRRAGTPNKKTEAWERIGEMLLNEWSEEIITIYKDLKPSQKCELYLQLLEYFKPKLSRSEIKADVNPIAQKIKTVYDEIQSESDLPEQMPK